MKRKKKIEHIISIFLSMVLLFTTVPISVTNVYAVTSEFAGGSGTQEDPYLIETKEQLNNVRNHLEAYYKMISNIEFSDADFAAGGSFYNDNSGWAPIGPDTEEPFIGFFDGNGHTISGLYINANIEADLYTGLFGYVRGKVQNLTISDSSISVVGASENQSNFKANVYIGTIAGSGYVINCNNSGDVDVTYKSTSQDCYIYAGGVIGYGTAIRCSNSGILSSTIPTASSHYVSVCLGGIAGDAQSIDQCTNTGSVSAQSSRYYDSILYVGGIAGIAMSVTKSYNIGDVTVIDDVYDNHIGGICGCGGSGSVISQCYNAGFINGNNNSDAGGIVGYIGGRGSVDNCFNIGIIDGGTCGGIVGDVFDSATIENCYNTGMIERESYASKYAILGSSVQPSVIKNCYCMSGVAQIKSDTVSCTPQEMLLQGTYVGFDFESIWVIGVNTNYPWPELRNASISSEIIDISRCEVTLDKIQIQYHTPKPEVTIKYNGQNLELNKDYFVRYSNEGIGTAKASVFGVGKYFNVKEIEYEIVKFDISNATLMTPWVSYEGGQSSGPFTLQDFVYDGTEKKQSSFRVCDPNDTIPSEFYDISYKNNVNVGTATLVITGKGDYYTGTIEKTFQILPRTVQSIAITTIPSKLVYIKGKEYLDVTGGKITVYYEDGGSEIIDMTQDMVYGFNNSFVGHQTLRIWYNGQTDTYDITIQDITHGDVNGDGTVTITDMIAIKAHLLGKSKLSGAGLNAADTNGDGNVTITDFIQVKAHLLGKSKL